MSGSGKSISKKKKIIALRAFHTCTSSCVKRGTIKQGSRIIIILTYRINHTFLMGWMKEELELRNIFTLTITDFGTVGVSQGFFSKTMYISAYVFRRYLQNGGGGFFFFLFLFFFFLTNRRPTASPLTWKVAGLLDSFLSLKKWWSKDVKKIPYNLNMTQEKKIQIIEIAP